MRTLPKHLRPRWRYLGIAIETWPGTEIDRRAFQAVLWEAARGLLGDPGSADCDLTVTRFRFDDERGIGDAIVRVRREEVSRGRAVLACVSDIDESPVGLVVRGVSGTIRGCRERLRDRPTPDSNDELAVRLPAVDDSPVGRPALEKSEGRFDVHTDEGFVGATALDVETGTDAETETPDTEERGA